MSTRTIARNSVRAKTHLYLAQSYNTRARFSLGLLFLSFANVPIVTCPEYCLVELMTDPEKAASNLDLGTPEPTGSTRAIHSIKASIWMMCSATIVKLAALSDRY